MEVDRDVNKTMTRSPFELPGYKYGLTRKSFIMQALYEFL